MSKYNVFIPQVLELASQGLSSDQVAQKIAETNSGISVASFGRWIRRHRDLFGKPSSTKEIVESLSKEAKQTVSSPAKVLLFDLETSPLVTYQWSPYQKYTSHDQMIQDWFIICWSAKWLFEDEILSACVTPKEANRFEDKRIVAPLWELFEEADIIIAHNCKRFDEKKANTRFIKNGHPVPSPYEVIDTLVHARRRFSLTHNRLDYIAKEYVGIEGKIKTDFDLWKRCLGITKDLSTRLPEVEQQEALREMSTYCDQDIRVLEDVYLWMRAWIKPHPNIGLHVGSSVPVCTCCGSNSLTALATPYRTYVNEFEAYRCNDCGHVIRARKNSTPTEVKERLTVSVPR